MAKGSIFFVAFFCALSMPLTACTPAGPKVELTVKFVAPPATLDLGSVEVRAGLDHRQTGWIGAGAERTITLYPGEVDPQYPRFKIWAWIYLQNAPSQQTPQWESEPLSMDKSYRFHLRVNEKGEVIGQRSCVMPCELWAKPQAVEGATR